VILILTLTLTLTLTLAKMQIISFDEVKISAGPDGYGCFDEAAIAFRLSAVHTAASNI
jgi:hypothetical protein